ncbi:MAG: DedA family protein [Magnetococcales bacterium]|nr:DedA family protein [Magnetococcales bacterium]
MSEQFTQFLLSLIGQLDYIAIFILMALESSIFPVPSELVMIPAGYRAAQGELDPGLIVLASSLGSIAGSLASYYLALWVGLPLIRRYGKYLFISQKHLDQSEAFIHRHGEISIFTGRFIPGIRHLISMPAGLARMRLTPFVVYTLIGATLWNVVLLVLGYLIGDHQEWLHDHQGSLVGGAILFVLLVVSLYLVWQRRRR